MASKVCAASARLLQAEVLLVVTIFLVLLITAIE